MYIFCKASSGKINCG